MNYICLFTIPQCSLSMNYSPIAADYNKVESADQTMLLLGYKTMIRFLSPPENKEILDYGCGTGIFARELRDQGAKVIGVDVSRGMIDIAKRNASHGILYYRIHSGDFEQFRDRSFDHAVSNFVFCAIPKKETIRLILSGIFRVLKENGSFIMMNSNWEVSNGREFVYHRLNYCENLVSGCRIRVTTKTDPPINFEDYFRSKMEYQELMEEAGFMTEAIEEPVAPENETFWLDERNYPPYYLIVGRKTS